MLPEHTPTQQQQFRRDWLATRAMNRHLHRVRLANTAAVIVLTICTLVLAGMAAVHIFGGIAP